MTPFVLHVLAWAWVLLPSAAIDPTIYEKLFLVNWPMFEKMTEKVVGHQAKDVLDLGTGPGQPALLIAQSLPSAQVHATDLQEAMITKAKARAAGVRNLDFSVASADNLSAFKSRSFDAVTMSYVLMFVKDQPKALREIGRVLRAGGRAILSVWHTMPMFSIAMDCYAEIAGAAPDKPPINPLDLAKEGAVEDLVEATNGLLAVEAVEPVSYPMLMGTGAETCEGAMIIVGTLLDALVKKGQTDAKSKFCSLFLKQLEERGMTTEKGTYEIRGSVAKLFTLRKPENFAGEEL